MKLKSLQNEIFRAIEIDGSSKGIQSVVSTPTLNAQDRLKTYQRSAYLKPYTCMEDDFQVTKIFLGDDFFDELVKEFLLHNPPDTHFINECGRKFPDFLKERMAVPEYPFIFDLAMMEWLRVESFFNFYDFRKSSEQKNEESEHVIHPNPSVIQFSSDWPIHEIWDKEVTRDPSATMAFIWTTEDRKVHCEAWTKEETTVLQVLLKSRSLEVAVAELTPLIDSEILRATFTNLSPQWMGAGLFEIKN